MSITNITDRERELYEALRKFWRIDERDLTGPLFSDVETTHHDIPLIAGWNPVHLAAGASK